MRGESVSAVPFSSVMPMNTPAAFDVGMSASSRCFRRNLKLPHNNTTATTGLIQMNQGMICGQDGQSRDWRSVRMLSGMQALCNDRNERQGDEIKIFVELEAADDSHVEPADGNGSSSLNSARSMKTCQL